MTPVTAEQLAEWKRLADAATKRPWCSGAVLVIARTAVPALVAEVERLRELVYRLSDALTDEGPDWSDEGLARLRDGAARALPNVEWLQEYRAALPEEPADG